MSNAKMWILPRYAWDTPPFLLIVSPTPHVQPVDACVCTYLRTYVLSVNHVIAKRKEVDHIPWVWGSVPRTLRARWSPAMNDDIQQFKAYDHSKTNFSFVSLAESPPRDLQITAYKIIVVCSCAMSTKCVWLQLIFCHRQRNLQNFLLLAIALAWKRQIISHPEDIH